MSDFWNMLSYIEVYELLTSAPILASEWKEFGGGFAGDKEWIRINIITNKDLVMVFESQDRTSFYGQTNGQYIWEIYIEPKVLSGVANSLEEAKKVADNELVNLNVRLA